MNNIFNGNELYIEENFKKNKVFCSIATTDNICTLGFEMTYKAKPKTLLRGNVLNSKILNVDLVLRKSRTSDKFNEIVLGDMSILLKSYEKLKHELSPRLIEVCEHALAQELSES